MFKNVVCNYQPFQIFSRNYPTEIEETWQNVYLVAGRSGEFLVFIFWRGAPENDFAGKLVSVYIQTQSAEKFLRDFSHWT